MFIRKRVLATLALAAAAALALAGCSGGSGAGAGSGSGSGEATFDPNQKVELTFTYWGTDDRANRFNALIAEFNKKYPNITINSTFTDYSSYWEKRQTEAAGGGLPDVWLFSNVYLRQYGQAGYLYDLSQVSKEVDLKAFTGPLKASGTLDGKQLSLPTGYSVWANFVNDDLLASTGVSDPKGGTSADEFGSWMKSVTSAGNGAVYGGTDPTQRIQNFELALRAQGKNLYTQDGQLGFTQKQLRDFWASGAADRKDVTIPQSKLEEISPKSGLGAKLTASEMSWSNFLGSYLTDSGSSHISMVAPPTAKQGSKDLYAQTGLQMAISANSKHPQAAALFLNYVVNSEKAGELFGTTLGFPASKTMLSGVKLEGADKEVSDYIASVKARVGDAPPVPVVGYGALEQKFWDLGKAIGLGSVSVDDAVTQFFAEAKTTLG